MGQPDAVTMVLFGLLAFCVVMIIISFNIRGKNKKRLEKKQKEMGFLWTGYYAHTTGLPIAENTMCNIYYYDSKMVIEGGGATFNLETSKLFDVTMTTDTEIQKSYASSIGGAVGGALLFGPLGAMIGGRAKEKKSTVVTTFLVFTYEKDGNPAYIAFNVTGQIFNVNKLINMIKSQVQVQKKEFNL